MAKKIKVVLTKGKDDYGAWLEGIPGIYGAGETPVEAKQSILEAISLYLKHNDIVPTALKGEYELVYKFDTASLLNYYKGIFTNAALERITGINQKQLQHYSTGLKKPRPAQTKKIETAFHKLGHELASVEF